MAGLLGEALGKIEDTSKGEPTEDGSPLPLQFLLKNLVGLEATIELSFCRELIFYPARWHPFLISTSYIFPAHGTPGICRKNNDVEAQLL